MERINAIVQWQTARYSPLQTVLNDKTPMHLDEGNRTSISTTVAAISNSASLAGLNLSPHLQRQVRNHEIGLTWSDNHQPSKESPYIALHLLSLSPWPWSVLLIAADLLRLPLKMALDRIQADLTKVILSLFQGSW